MTEVNSEIECPRCRHYWFRNHGLPCVGCGYSEPTPPKQEGPYRVAPSKTTLHGFEVAGPSQTVSMEHGNPASVAWLADRMNEAFLQGQRSSEERWEFLKGYIKVKELLASMTADEKQYERGRNAMANEVLTKMAKLEIK